MAEIVNLRRARKAKDKAAKDKVADTNRVTHGTPKRLHELAKARTDKAARDLDAHKKGDEDKGRFEKNLGKIAKTKPKKPNT